MGTYRVEISVSARAGCQATQCKKENVKIQKGEIRQGTWVEIGEYQSWKWRHWGCVTPTVLHNWLEDAKGDSDDVDPELIDGYDALPETAQEMVRRCFEQGHVDDADWNGDIEMNRYNAANPRQGMFSKVKPAKKEDGEETVPSKKASKKRSRKDDDDDDQAAESVPKKSRGKKATKAEPDEDRTDESAPKKGRSKKSVTSKSDENAADEEHTTKIARSKKSIKPKPEADADGEEPTTKKARSKKSIKPEPKEDAAGEESTAKKARSKKSVKPELEDNEAVEGHVAKKSRGSKAVKSEHNVDLEPPAPAKKAAKAKKIKAELDIDDGDDDVRYEEPVAKPSKKKARVVKTADLDKGPSTNGSKKSAEDQDSGAVPARTKPNGRKLKANETVPDGEEPERAVSRKRSRSHSKNAATEE